MRNNQVTYVGYREITYDRAMHNVKHGHVSKKEMSHGSCTAGGSI